jgi:hypothetical protein
VRLENKFESPKNMGDKSIILTDSMSSGKYGSFANPGITFGTSHGAMKNTIALAKIIRVKNTVNISFEKDFPSSLPFPKRSMKYGKSIDADTSEPIEANIISGIRNAE